jgi:hypothetical protein
MMVLKVSDSAKKFFIVLSFFEINLGTTEN